MKRGFTLIELLVVVTVIALLIGILVPVLGKAKETANRARCGGNLNAIAKSCIVYATDSNDDYPAVPPPGDSTPIGTWTFPATSYGNDGSADDALTYEYTDLGGFFNTEGDPMASLWVLTLQSMAVPKLFLCPSDPTQPQVADETYTLPNPGYFQNFGEVGPQDFMNTFSYSWSYPWYAYKTKPGPWWHNTQDATLPIGCDMAPTSGSGPADDATAAPGTAPSNSKNHGGFGQNVVFADAHVEFSKTNRAGQNGDNIFCINGNAIFVLPASAGSGLSDPTGLNSLPQSTPYDVIMVPARP